MIREEMGSPFSSPCQLWSKNWLVLGSSMALAGEQVAWSTALGLFLHGRPSTRHPALLGVSGTAGWAGGVQVCMRQLVHCSGCGDRF